MKITSVSYSRLVSLGNYENEKVGGIAALDEQEDPVAAMEALRAWVLAQIDAREEIKDLADQMRKLQHDLDEVNQSLKTARRMWGSAKQFLLHHGAKPPPDPWWWTRQSEAEDEDNDDYDPVGDRPIPGLP